MIRTAKIDVSGLDLGAMHQRPEARETCSTACFSCLGSPRRSTVERSPIRSAALAGSPRCRFLEGAARSTTTDRRHQARHAADRRQDNAVYRTIWRYLNHGLARARDAVRGPSTGLEDPGERRRCRRLGCPLRPDEVHRSLAPSGTNAGHAREAGDRGGRSLCCPGENACTAARSWRSLPWGSSWEDELKVARGTCLGRRNTASLRPTPIGARHLCKFALQLGPSAGSLRRITVDDRCDRGPSTGGVELRPAE